MTIPSGYAQALIGYTGNNAPTGAANVFGLELLDSMLTPTDVAEIVRSTWASTIMTELTDDVTMSAVRVKFGPDSTGPFVETAASTVGGNTTTSLSPNTAYLATKVTPVGGRRGRGRLYFPGVADTAANDSGVISAGYIALLQPLLDNILSGLTTAGCPMVVLHSPATTWVLVNGQPRRQPVAGSLPVPSEVLSLPLAARAATQRRRMRR